MEKGKRILLSITFSCAFNASVVFSLYFTFSASAGYFYLILSKYHKRNGFNFTCISFRLYESGSFPSIYL